MTKNERGKHASLQSIGLLRHDDTHVAKQLHARGGREAVRGELPAAGSASRRRDDGSDRAHLESKGKPRGDLSRPGGHTAGRRAGKT